MGGLWIGIRNIIGNNVKCPVAMANCAVAMGECQAFGGEGFIEGANRGKIPANYELLKATF